MHIIKKDKNYKGFESCTYQKLKTKLKVGIIIKMKMNLF